LARAKETLMKRLVIAVVTATLTLLALPGTAVAQPTNDDFDNATLVTEPLPFTDSISTAEATTAPDDPECLGSGATVWYSYTPASTGLVSASTAGSSYDTTVSVYTGTRGALINETGCADTAVVWNAIAGTTYYLMVGSLFGSPGGQLTFTVQGPPTLDVTLDPVGHFDPRTGVALVSGTVTCTGTGSVRIDGELRQAVGRFTISGLFLTFVEGSQCDGTPQPWTAEVTAGNGKFAGGKAAAGVFAQACPSAEICVSDSEERTIRLRP
jgi:hypothetical protein